MLERSDRTVSLSGRYRTVVREHPDTGKEGRDEQAKEVRRGGPRSAEGGKKRQNAPRKGGASDSNSGEHGEGPQGQADDIPDASGAGLAFPPQTPLFHAQHSDRYARQELIRAYEELYGSRLIVLIDVIFPESVTLFEELLVGADKADDLHLMLDTPGGDGETAIRLVRAAQARCHELTVIVPNQAKSAGTILAFGAHHILMGPTSDLGPVDPQFPNPSGPGLYSAKDLIAAVEAAEKAVTEKPDTYALHASLLADVSALMVQQARSALGRTDDLVREALASNPDRSAKQVEQITKTIKETLVDLPKDHGAVFGAVDADRVELPVIEADPESDQWKLIWQLWAKYFALDHYVYEGRSASQTMPRRPA
jgi:hypothetical protein